MKKYKRAFLKALIWRLIATITSIVGLFLLTGDLRIGLSFGAIDVTVKFVLYYLHELAWETTKNYN